MSPAPAPEAPARAGGARRFTTLAVLNTALRVATLLAKFALLFFLARYLPAADVGVYGLFVATVGLVLVVLGMEFHSFNSREMLATDRVQWPGLLRDQASFHLVTYVIVLPLLGLLFVTRILEPALAPWFYAILILEHLNQEAYRILVTMSRPLRANLVLFLRAGLWVGPLVLVLQAEPGLRRLETVWGAWLAGLAVAGLAACVPLARLPWRHAARRHADAARIRRGLRVAAPFLLSSVALWGIYTVDRYVLRATRDATAVGIYTFHVGVTRVVFLFAEAAVGMILYPHVVRAFQMGDAAAVRRRVRQLAFGVVAVAVAMAGLLAVGIRPVVAALGRPEYGSDLVPFALLLGASVLLAVGLWPHFVLYARRQDRTLVLASVTGLGVAVLGDVLLAGHYGIRGVALGTLLGLAATVGMKFAGCGNPWRPAPDPRGAATPAGGFEVEREAP